jgi:magnesium transporter
MALAMLLNMIVAALAGILIPLTMERMNRDPALGSSVLLTATTDSMGFFIFLGLATLFLL